LDGGILGRIDEMVIVRGNNVFPSAVEGFLRRFDEVAEFRIECDRRPAMAELRLVIETRAQVEEAGLVEKLTAVFRDQFHFRPAVALVAPGTLPRFEMKARRFVMTDGRKD
jgi:phenylacetate-CoA ligase